MLQASLNHLINFNLSAECVSQKKYLCDMSTKQLVTIRKMSTKYQATGMICVKEKLKVVWQIENSMCLTEDYQGIRVTRHQTAMLVSQDGGH